MGDINNMEQGNVTSSKAARPPQDGYDLAVYGIANGQFYNLHIPAITFIFLSFFSAVAVLVASFKLQSYRTFFSWTKSERFVVYLAVCDGLFNMAHSMDHLHILITRDHVYPKELCQFYGFMLIEFITAQNLMVNVVAFNAVIIIYFRKNLEFGRYDWRLILYMFGVPFFAATIAASLGELGPNGAFCYFDGVKGEMANIFLTTVPIILILLINIVLYCLTWYRIQTEAKHLKESLGKDAKMINASHKAARNMSLFVAAFFVQWWALAIYGIWQLIAVVPQLLFQMMTTFSNVGGILNGIVFILLKRRKLMARKELSFVNVNAAMNTKENEKDKADDRTDVSFLDKEIS